MKTEKFSLRKPLETTRTERFTGRFLALQVHASRTAGAPTGKVILLVRADSAAPFIQATKSDNSPYEVLIADPPADNMAEAGFVFENPGYHEFALRFIRDPYADPLPGAPYTTDTNFAQLFWSQR
jgi:hypothetical protein